MTDFDRLGEVLAELNQQYGHRAVALRAADLALEDTKDVEAVGRDEQAPAAPPEFVYRLQHHGKEITRMKLRVTPQVGELIWFQRDGGAEPVLFEVMGIVHFSKATRWLGLEVRETSFGSY